MPAWPLTKHFLCRQRRRRGSRPNRTRGRYASGSGRFSGPFLGHPGAAAFVAVAVADAVTSVATRVVVWRGVVIGALREVVAPAGVVDPVALAAVVVTTVAEFGGGRKLSGGDRTACPLAKFLLSSCLSLL